MELEHFRQEEETLERQQQENRREESRLLQIYDGLTGTMKMHAFREQAEKIARRNPDKCFSVVYFNILDFKNFNERYGFEQGNRLIIALSDIIREYFPKSLIGRLFGDQFVLFCEKEEVYPAVGYVNNEFRDINLNLEMELKAGIFTLSEENYDVNIACDRAKTAAESIKRQRWLSYRYYDEELSQQLLRKRTIVENIYTAISEKQIEVYYQPVVRNLTGEICGMEALVRWRDPVYGLMVPGEFISVLEEYQLISKLDLHVVRLVCEKLRELKDSGSPMVPVSFNLSRLDFQLCDIFEEIETLARFYRIPREMLHVEITESMLAGDPQKVKTDIQRFHNAGYQVWMDDFGSGYSSLNLLKDFEVDLLKIDMLFLRDFSEKSKKIIASIVDMAKKVGVRTLAEGVETREQLEFLRDIGCEKSQGYYIGKPRSYEETMQKLVQDGYSMEKRELWKYGETLGSVNLLNSDEFYNSSRSAERLKGYEALIPVGIVELYQDKLRILYRNTAFLQIFQRLEELSERHAMESLNERGTELYQNCRSFLKVLRVKRQAESIDLMVRGHLCSIRGKFLGESRDRQAFLVSLQSLASFSNVSDKRARLEETMRNIYDMYEMVMMILPARNRCFFVHQSHEYFRDGHSHAITEVREYFCDRYIHPEDMEEYWEFLDPETMEQRLQMEEQGTLDCFLRIKKQRGEYRWMQMSLKPVMQNKSLQLMLTLRAVVNREIIGFLEKR